MSKAPPSLDFYPNDWHGGTKHLPLVDRACYFELLLYQWSNGHIPEDPAVRMHLCGLSEDLWRAVWARIKDKFEPKVLEDGNTVLVNVRMDVDRDEAIASWKPRKQVSDARRRAGKKGGIASGRSRRSSQTPLNKGSNPRSKSEAKTKQNEAKQEGGNRKGEDGRKKQEKGMYSGSFLTFWSLYPKSGKNRKADAMKHWSKIDAAEHQTIFDVLPVYALSDKVQNGFGMNAPNWIRDRCWEDDPESWNQTITEPTKVKKPNNDYFD